jgi:molybdopterin molybdotransferase
LLSVAEAQKRLLDFFTPLEPENVPLARVCNRVLAKPISSEYDVPLFPNSSMDGFAIQFEDVTHASVDKPKTLSVVADIPAGIEPECTIRSGQAARIMTGAMMPQGADAVIQFEDTDFIVRSPESKMPPTVKISRPVMKGENIRSRGQDFHARDILLQSGKKITPQDVGLISMLGIPVVPVYRKPRVAIFSSGDELLPVEAPLTGGKIHDANSYILVSLVEKVGGEPINLGIVDDHPENIVAFLRRAIANAVDLIISSAGVSVGAFDFVRNVVEQEGRLEFWKVNMRPGKPLAFGHYQGVPFFGLPGNPVSAFVGFEVFVRPALYKLSGITGYMRNTHRARLLEPIESDGRESYLRAVISVDKGKKVVRLTGHQGSGNLYSLVQANALLLVPSGVKSLPAGAEVEYWPLDEIG